MAWTIEFTPLVDRQMAKLDRSSSKRIMTFLFDRLSTYENPRKTGKPLQGSDLGEFWRYRVGDYRILCEIVDKRCIVLVVKIAHRREVYR